MAVAVDTEMLASPLRATVLHHLGLDDERIVEVEWDDLAQLSRVSGITADHLTSVYVSALPGSSGAAIERLEEQMRALRARCPWDREQTHESLARYVVEEAAELVEAIDSLGEASDADDARVRHLCGELGDVLFQVVFHARLASEQGWFTLADVADTLFAKMERRHPHVFAGLDVADAAEVARNWEAIKAAERAEAAARQGTAH
jgi:uncharacterized protein YabN with tetrapyrrole methylase and pyrophosphatase domain